MTDEITQNDCQGEDAYMAFYTKLSPMEKQLFKAIGIPFQLQDFGHNILEEDGEYFEQTSEQMDRFTEANKIALSKVMSIVRSDNERLNAELTEAREVIGGLYEMIAGLNSIIKNFAEKEGFDTSSLVDPFAMTPEEGSLFHRARAFLTKGETDNG